MDPITILAALGTVVASIKAADEAGLLPAMTPKDTTPDVVVTPSTTIDLSALGLPDRIIDDMQTAVNAAVTAREVENETVSNVDTTALVVGGLVAAGIGYYFLRG